MQILWRYSPRSPPHKLKSQHSSKSLTRLPLITLIHLKEVALELADFREIASKQVEELRAKLSDDISKGRVNVEQIDNQVKITLADQGSFTSGECQSQGRILWCFKSRGEALGQLRVKWWWLVIRTVYLLRSVNDFSPTGIYPCLDRRLWWIISCGGRVHQ